MNRKSTNAALAILLSGAAIVAPAFAQDAGKPTPGANLQYVGGNTRLGIGIDSENDVRGELFQVFSIDDKSASLGELWAGRRAGGAKLSYHWTASGAAVNKVFAAYDQGQDSVRKATLGGGQEYEKWFWNAYLSKGLSGARLAGTTSVSNTVTVSGTDAGRPFEEDVTTVTTTRAFQKAYDWGVGARAGHFYENHLLRVTAGLDYEWGKYSSRQWTGSLLAEKYFAGSPLSIALSGEINRRNGDFETTKNDRRGYVLLRYELGAPATSFRPNKITRTVTTTERVPDPNWKPPVAAAGSEQAASGTAATPAEPSFRMEKRTTRANNNDAQETYFDLGSARLKPAALKELDALVDRIAAQRPYVELKVNVVGHTCPTGSDRNNFPLSSKRAEAVKAYLVSKGVPGNLISTDGKAGKAPKYPEVKGQSFRNRRADTEVLIVKEKTEDVRVPVAAAARTSPPPQAATPATATAQATAPMIERQVQRDVVEDVPNNWIARALHNSAQHKTSVDTYRWLETSSAQSTGPRRYLNRGPAAVADSYTVSCDAPTTLNVLVNDTDPDSDSLTITNVSSPSRGTAVISNGRVVYTPNAASCAGGTDSFTYTISDGRGGTSTATVNISITAQPTNVAPVAVNDVFVVPCRIGASLDVLANDRDPDGDPLTITSITQPTRAAIAIASNGKSLTYTPGPVCFINDTFTYTISDGKGGTSTATVTLIDP